MNGLRYVIALCLVFLISLIGMQGVADNKKEKSNQILKATNVAEAFYQEGIQLQLSPELSPADYRINEKLPVIYNFPDSGEKLFIYDLSSIENVYHTIEKITNEEILKNIQGFAELQNGCLINSLQAKNLLLLYVVKYDVQAASEIRDMTSLYQFTRNIAPHMEDLKRIAFSKLNDGVTVKYQGSSSSWEGKVVLDYYQHFWKDKDGLTKYESWNNQEFYLKYLGTDADNLNEIMCSYEGPAGGGQGIFQYPNQSFDSDGYLRLGSSGGNSLINPNVKYTMTIRWEHGADIFVLEPVE